jgi:hypothetical protein
LLRLLCAGAVVVLGLTGCSEPRAEGREIVFTGMCDASAGVALDGRRFVVANDEDSILRTYDFSGGAPLETLDLSGFLKVDREEPESDLEGAARLGNRVYWITSHGRSREGNLRASRHRLFATEFVTNNGVTGLQPVGRPYDRLLEDLTGSPRLARFDLAAASTLEPKARGALNIEGLCVTAEGHLWIGFRNPIPGGRALLVPLLNPAAVVAGGTAELGDPMLVDLGGLGIRDIVFAGGKFVLAAGSYNGGNEAALFEWEGPGTKPERWPGLDLKGWNPEAILPVSGAGTSDFHLFSDDGSRKVAGKDCKDWEDPALKRFRGMRIRR